MERDKTELTLQLPLVHALCRRGPDDEQVGQAGHKDGGDGDQDAPGVGRVEHAGDAAGDVGAEQTALPARVGQGQDDGQGRLHGEVDGEDLGHEGRELGPLEDLEGHDAAYEGLVWGWGVGGVRRRCCDGVVCVSIYERGVGRGGLRERRWSRGECHS